MIQTLHDRSLVWPNGITIDYETQTLYWMDAKFKKLERSGVDGSNRRIISVQSIYHPYSITLFDGVFYWSDWSTQQVMYAPVSSPANVSDLVPVLQQQPLTVKVVSPKLQPIPGELRWSTCVDT